MSLSESEVAYLKARLNALETQYMDIEVRLADIDSLLKEIKWALRIEEGVRTNRPADAGETKW